MEEVRLTELKPGDFGEVSKIFGKGFTRRRILDLGIVKGTKVKVVRKAPLGDPVEIEIRDYNLTLRKLEAENIWVVKGESK